MSKPEKPKASAEEKMQVQLAGKMTEKGSQIKGANLNASLGDQRYDSASMGTSVQGARGAAGSAARLKAMRRSGVTSAARSQMDTGVDGIATKAMGGRTVDPRLASRNISSVSQLGSTLSSFGQSEDMRKFEESNRKKQAMMDVVLAAGMQMAYSSGGETKLNKDNVDSKVNYGNGGQNSGPRDSDIYSIPGQENFGYMHS